MSRHEEPEPPHRVELVSGRFDDLDTNDVCGAVRLAVDHEDVLEPGSYASPVPYNAITVAVFFARRLFCKACNLAYFQLELRRAT